MNGHDPDKGNDFCVSNEKATQDEWIKIIDRVETAILMSLANKVLADAGLEQSRNQEHRRELKLVQLRSFSRKHSVG